MIPGPGGFSFGLKIIEFCIKKSEGKKEHSRVGTTLKLCTEA